ncbi:sulfate adenylyltransferase subunit 1 [Flavobacterium kingsejongi]|uniref:sulfate adenylyltransferase n=1 Tax=Flavobacterium kingsejongi TaxID=1678728 RepID=A0A2S1LNS5_9FLAO|nr:GTP-binding protein [Flavobacterium kingsejongi]AWG25348.1 sulfate adenylyltransferase [Flavobacterium kingsejongi]
MDLIRINTAGSVDDGKSTLIGRFLYDSQALTIEQEALIEKKTKEKGLEDLDFSVITDGLIAEREQGITIDVAHIYFSTESRKFIIADSPGHVEYTRNMVTGASNSEVSVILIDSRKGVLEQTHRHYFISRLLKLHTVVFCINKMDLSDYSEDVFLNIAADIDKMIAQFPPLAQQTQIIPISSLKGDNIVLASENMDWYKGATLSGILHTIDTRAVQPLGFRFDVQQVQHVQNTEFTDYRAYAGKVTSGTVKVGDEILVIPSLQKSIVTEIRKFKTTFDTATAGQSIQIRLRDNIDISRGMVLVHEISEHLLKREIEATVVWMDEKPATTSGKYMLEAGSRSVVSKIQSINAVIPPEKPLAPYQASELRLNDIGQIRLKLGGPVFLDVFEDNRQNGAFILIDTQTNNTVAVGFVA